MRTLRKVKWCDMLDSYVVNLEHGEFPIPKAHPDNLYEHLMQLNQFYKASPKVVSYELSMARSFGQRAAAARRQQNELK